MASLQLTKALRAVVTFVVAALSCFGFCASNLDRLRPVSADCRPGSSEQAVLPTQEAPAEQRTQKTADYGEFGEEGEAPGPQSPNLAKATATSRRRILPPSLPLPLVVSVAPLAAFAPPQPPVVRTFVQPLADRVHVDHRRFLI